MNLVSTLIGLLQRSLTPKRLWSWHTCLLVVLLFWLFAALTAPPRQMIFAGLAFIFFIVGVGIFITENPVSLFGVSLNNWILSICLCLFVFGGANGQLNQWFWVSFPSLAAAIALAPEFVRLGRFTVPDSSKRQRIIIFFLSHVLVSCWFQFHFKIDNWIERNPNLMQGDFSRSGFVIEVDY